MNWESAFEKEYQKCKGASEEEIKIFLETWNEELSEMEVLEIN